MKLSDLRIDQPAKIISLDAKALTATALERLLEMGFLEGSTVILKHQGWGGDPLAVEVRGGIIALRKNEASLIEVKPAEAQT